MADVPAPIPVWVITGALGVGKTTTIARLMAHKPAEQNWIVILNEFTESGIDALTVAGNARGAYDVRLVPGGCLCCTGELDFARQLRELTRTTRPDRIIIEPSGIGHPAAITEELLQHQAHGTLLVESIVCIVDPTRIARLAAQTDSVARAQAEVADVLVLAKTDLASAPQREEFARLAGSFFPAKSWSGEMQFGAMPAQALVAHGLRERAMVPRSGAHLEPHHHDPVPQTAGMAAASSIVPIGAFMATRQHRSHLGRDVLSWIMPREAVFARTRLRDLLREQPDIERFKGVFRTGPEMWLLVQSVGGELEFAESAWRRDSRAEALYSPAVPADAAGFEQALGATLARR